MRREQTATDFMTPHPQRDRKFPPPLSIQPGREENTFDLEDARD